VTLLEEIAQLRPTWYVEGDANRVVAIALREKASNTQKERRYENTALQLENMWRHFSDRQSALQVVICTDSWLQSRYLYHINTFYLCKKMTKLGITRLLRRVTNVRPMLGERLVVDYWDNTALIYDVLTSRT
jgi:hypothetical protein